MDENYNKSEERPVLDSTETIWSIGTTNNSMEEEENPPLLSRRTDTINSSTQYFSLTDVQPRNTELYTGVTIQPIDQPRVEDIILENVPEQRTGVKRHHEEGLNSSYLEQSKVIIVSGDRSFSDDIPLGGTAVELQLEPDLTHPLTFPSATCSNPSLEHYPGQYDFQSIFTKLSESSKNRHWDYSPLLSKLYIDMNKWVQVEFHVGTSPQPGLTIRLLPIFSDANYITQPVKRCPNHAELSDPTNENFPYTKHLIRVAGDDITYQEDTTSGRLSVTFPVMAPAAGSERISKQIKFMCLGSDVGGINRRPVKVLFTLETGEGQVVGRNVFDVRMCSCPKRDKQQEEEKHLKQEDQARSIAKKFADSTVVMKKGEPETVNPPPGKKHLKIIDNTKYLMIPVRFEDFKMLDDFAERLAVGREIQNSPNIPHSHVIQAIKAERMKLHKEHNQQVVNFLGQKKK